MADRKIYETQFLLGAKVQSSVGTSFGAVQKNMRAIQQQAAASQKASSGMGNALKWVGGIAGTYLGVSAILNYSKASSEAAQGEIANTTKLTTIMRQRTKATDTQIKAVLQLADAQKNLGVVDDDAQIAGAQQLATFINRADSLKVLMPAMNNLLAQQKGVNATEEDAVNIGNMMGKVFTGQIGALTRVGITFSKAQEQVLKYGNEQQKAAMLAQVITENVGQMNAALAKTDDGKLAKANMELGDIQKKVGFKIIPLQVKMAEAFLKISPAIDKMLPLLDYIPPVINKIADAIVFVVKNWDMIEPIVIGVTTALIANKVATWALVSAQTKGMIINKLISGWQTASAALALLREGNSLAAVAQLVLNGTMWACPITWIVAGITALVVGAYLLIKNWDKVKKFFSGLWTWLKKNWQDVLMAVFMPFIGIPMLIIKNWSKIVGFFGGGSKGKTPKKTPNHARGTPYFAGGLTWAGENGPELVNLPRGSQIFSNSRTKDLMAGLTGQGGSPSIVYSPVQNFYGPTDKEAVMEANKESSADFERRMNAYFGRRKRLQFA
jgi:hypothetical protein